MARRPRRPPQPAPQTAAAPTALSSELDARLFYQLLIGEIELRSGEAGTAYQVMLDAARRTGNEEVFRRATDIALQARAGDQALAAVQAWRTALPGSTEALRYQVQLLIALNRPGETLEPLGELLRLTPLPQRPAMLRGAAALLRAQRRPQGRGRVAGQGARSPTSTRPARRPPPGSRSGAAGWPRSTPPRRSTSPGAPTPPSRRPRARRCSRWRCCPARRRRRPWSRTIWMPRPADTNTRLLYVRMLAGSQRYAEAVTQLEGPDAARAAARAPLAHARRAATRAEASRRGDRRRCSQYVTLVEGGAAVSIVPAASAPCRRRRGADAPRRSR